MKCFQISLSEISKFHFRLTQADGLTTPGTDQLPATIRALHSMEARAHGVSKAAHDLQDKKTGAGTVQQLLFKGEKRQRQTSMR